MEHIYIFDKLIRTTEIDGSRYIVLNDVCAAAEVSWKDFCMARTPLELFESTEMRPLYRDLAVRTVDGLVMMPIEKTETFILRAATGTRPLTPFSVLSECCRSVVDFWAARDASNGEDDRNVFVMCNEEDQTFRNIIPE